MDQQRRVVDDIRPARSLDGMGPVGSRTQNPQPAQPQPAQPAPVRPPAPQPLRPVQRPVQPLARPQQPQPQPAQQPQQVAEAPQQAPRKKGKKLRTAISAIGIFLLILALLGGIAYIFFQYYR